MAEEAEKSSKTEEPSGRRLQRAAAQGQVALSREAVGFGTLLLAGAGLFVWLPGLIGEALLTFRGTLARGHELSADGAARAWLAQFLWLTLPEGIDTTPMLARAVARKVAYVPGAPFFALGGGQNTMRLSYCTAAPEQIETGMKALGETIREALGSGQ